MLPKLFLGLVAVDLLRELLVAKYRCIFDRGWTLSHLFNRFAISLHPFLFIVRLNVHIILFLGKNSPGDMTTLVELMYPILEKYNVDAYICGHDHILQVICVYVVTSSVLVI